MPKKAPNNQKKEQQLLTETAVPIITVSASYKEDLKGFLDQAENDQLTDIVLSRAHYSMAVGIAVEAWGKKIDPKKAWLVDPTNHVSQKDWSSIEITNIIGKTIARWPILKTLKDMVDKFGRSKLPILDSITPATLFLTKDIEKPILSFHIATGNILVENGKKVVEMITDPHVREDYVKNAANPNIKFCVFDEGTKKEFFEVAKKEGIKIPKEQLKDKVIVTGPPIDPRVVAIGKNKKTWDGKRPLRIMLSTGGLGTNKTEIKDLLQQLLPALKKKTAEMPDFELMFYAGTHSDHKKMAVRLAKRYGVSYKVISPHDPADFEMAGDLVSDGKKAQLFSHQSKRRTKFHIIQHPQIIDANELLIHYGFPWTDVIISKPSGDMAYDCALAGCALLTMKEWGEWEHNVRQVFEDRSVAKKANVEQIIEQIIKLSQSENVSATADSKKPKSSTRPVPQLEESKSQKTQEVAWITKAMQATKKLEPIFYQGAKNILSAAKNAKF